MTVESAEASPASSGRVESVRAAQRAWAARPLGARIRAVGKARRRLLARAPELARLLDEAGDAPAAEALFLEIVPSAELFEYWLRAAPDFLSPIEVDLPSLIHSGKSARTVRAPRGVIGLVTPPEYALALPLRTIVPALIAGDAVMWSPAEGARPVAKLVAQAFEGLVPENVLSIAAPSTSGDIDVHGLDWIVFAGSEDEGRKILGACAKEVVPSSLEIGGDDAAIVLADARLERTARGIVWAARAGGGKSPSAIKHVYAEKKIADDLSRRLSEISKETQGVSISVVAVDGIDAAAERVRALGRSLTTSVWTTNLDRSAEIAALLGTPFVSFNCHGPGGLFGVANGPFALDALTRPSLVVEDRSVRARDMYWRPYTPALERAGFELVKVRSGASFFGRIVAWLSLVAALTKRVFER